MLGSSRRARAVMLAHALVLVVLAAAVVAPGASAATLHVDAAAAAGGNCRSAETPCATIAAAVAAAWTTPEDDTVLVAAGTYPEQVNLNLSTPAGVAIVGAGSGPDGTVLRPPGSGGVTLTQPRQSVRGVRIEMPADGSSNVKAIYTTSPDPLIEDVAVVMNNPAANQPAVMITTGTATLRGLDVSGVWSGGALYADRAVDELSISDSRLIGNASTTAYVAPAIRATIARTRVHSTSSTGTLVMTESRALEVQSSLLTGGARGLQVTGSGGARATATLRDSTVDVGASGVDDARGGGTASYLIAYGDDTDVRLVVDGSILVEPHAPGYVEPGKTGHVAVECRASDVPDQAESWSGGRSTVACGTAPGNADGNTSSKPEVLFVGGDAAAYDHRLRPGSPAVDTGTADERGEETDLAGNPRVLDGNGDCVARRDRGAYELTGHAGAPPAGVAIDVGVPATAGAPVTLTGRSEPAGTLTYAWTLGDGTTASGREIRHTFAAPGTYDVELVVTAETGCSTAAMARVPVGAPRVDPPPNVDPPAGPPPENPPVGNPPVDDPPLDRPASDTTAPALSRVKLSPRRFRAAGRAPRGATLSLRLSEAATVHVRVERRRSCPTTTRNRPCRRWAAAGALKRAAGAGAVRIRLTGKLGGRALRPGRYRAVIVAVDAAGNRSRSTVVAFTVVRR